MPTTFDVTLNTFQEDCTTAQLTNETVYGAPNPDRNTLALRLIAGHVNSSSVITLVTATPVDADPVVNAAWDFDTPQDSHYQFILFSISDFWNVATVYLIDEITYDVAGGGFYKALQNSFDTSPVTDTAYWQLLTDDDLLSEVDNATATVEVFIYDDIVDCRGNDCLRDFLEEAIDNGLCKGGKEIDFKLVKEDWDKMDLLVNGANAKNFTGKMSEAEEIIREYSDFCDLNNC
jgi:hypothetical protein